MYRSLGYSLRDFCGLVLSQPAILRYRRLQNQFGFHPWHVQSPYLRRAYKARVVALINGLHPQTVVEIGCGLGEIIKRTQARYRFGFDRELAAVNAASAVGRCDVRFHHGDLLRPDDIARVVGRPIDVLVAVNWPHMLAFDSLARALDELARNVAIDVLVVDTIRPERSGYEHYHTEVDLARLGTIIATRSGGDGIRALHAVKLFAPAKA